MEPAFTVCKKGTPRAGTETATKSLLFYLFVSKNMETCCYYIGYKDI